MILFNEYAEEYQLPPIGDLVTEDLETYLAYLQSRPKWSGGRKRKMAIGLSPSSVETQYRRLRRLFSWLVDRGHVPANPFLAIPHPKLTEREVLPLADEEQAAFVKLVDPRLYTSPVHRWRAIRNRAAVYLLLDTPGRRDEIGNMTVGDVELGTGEVKVLGKGGRERWMPIGFTAQEALWEYLAVRENVVGTRHGRLWVESNGRAMKPTWLYLMTKRLGARAGIIGMHTHRTRHNYAVRALRGMMPLPILERVGGWKRIPATYLKTLGREDAVTFHRAVSPLDKMEHVSIDRRPRRRL